MELVVQFVLVLVLGMGLALVVWLEKVKEDYWSQETEKDLHYLDLRKDSRLAQAQSLAALGQKDKDSAHLKTQSTDGTYRGQNES